MPSRHASMVRLRDPAAVPGTPAMKSVKFAVCGLTLLIHEQLMSQCLDYVRPSLNKLTTDVMPSYTTVTSGRGIYTTQLKEKPQQWTIDTYSCFTTIEACFPPRTSRSYTSHVSATLDQRQRMIRMHRYRFFNIKYQ